MTGTPELPDELIWMFINRNKLRLFLNFQITVAKTLS